MGEPEQERKLSIPPEALAAQAEASAPAEHIWVSANAGSGKTYVLTQRVKRILLEGTDPQNILCLTYTKAAAAEMLSRVSKDLAKWTMMDEAALRADLRELTGQMPTPPIMERARTLFAFALETPGGLKIKTIHAFAEAILHRFPLEAGVPVQFSVMEDEEHQGLIQRIREEVLASGLYLEGAHAKSILKLFEHQSDTNIEKAVAGALALPQTAQLLKDKPAALANLHELLALPEGVSLTSIDAQILAEPLFSAHDSAALIAEFGPDDGVLMRLLAQRDWQNPSLADHLTIFLTAKDEPRARDFKKAYQTQFPQIYANYLAEQARLVELLDLRKSVLTFELSTSLLDLMELVYERYRAEKRARARLDYDDLIDHLLELLRDRSARDWVRYKLDAQITHILVDEGQDTNAGQWAAIEMLIAEFFAGEGAVQRQRSIFAVGDEKQSIYSFQGAAPKLFSAVRDRARALAKHVEQDVTNVRLQTSFRSAPAILELVDAVAKREDIHQALLAEGEVKHVSARADAIGRITLWPQAEKSSDAASANKDWPLAPDQVSKSQSKPELEIENAKFIVSQISDWLKTGRPLADRGRPIRPDDILILVQKRGTLFAEIIRQLKLAQIPTPGGDRLEVTGHIMVADLVALAQFLLNPDDDLSLAAILRSPLFDVSAKDLERLADRPNTQSLWYRLSKEAERADADARIRQAFEQLSEKRKTLDLHRPFEFFAQILYHQGGLLKFKSRLGMEVDDVALEFMQLALAHEQSDQPSLLGFLHEISSAQFAVKRELSEAQGVRILTVHGAKGLEAPVVILADATETPRFRETIFGATHPKPIFAFSPNKDTRPQAMETQIVQPARALETQEYWRKLYVALTRAEDELYIAGTETPKAQQGQNWYDVVKEALGEKWHEVTSPNVAASILAYPAQSDSPPKKATRAVDDRDDSRSLAKMEFSPLPTFERVQHITPSGADEHLHLAATGRENEDEAVSTVRADLARKRGIALHALLQYLAPIDEEHMERAAHSALQTLLPEAPDMHDELVAKAQSIFASPTAQLLFGENSRAEVPVAATLLKGGQKFRLDGRIDRLIVAAEHIHIVDFKSDAQPPKNEEQLSSAYIRQMGFYALVLGQIFEAQPIKASLFFTTSESFIPISAQSLEQAAAEYEIA